MNKIDLERFSSSAELAQTAAARWIDMIASAAKTGGAQLVGLSGGRIARDLFKAASQSEPVERGIARERSFLLGG